MTPNAVDFLARIASDRRRRVAAMQAATPAHVLRGRLGRIEPAGRLERALRRGLPANPMRLLCEVKRASPSKGMLRENVDPVAIAKLYESGGASGVSLVTEPDHFHGDPVWMDAVRPAVRLPLLLKDFIVDPYQILDAAARGADAVLLLAALLSETEMQRFITEARLLGLDALVEIHEESELKGVLRAGATLIGLNNRSLHTFEVDVTTTGRLLPLLPPYVTTVAESGLSHAEDLARLRETRCDAVLMGEVFMTSADPAGTLATLLAAARGTA